MIPHYILFSHSKDALIPYSCDKNGNGSMDKTHWKLIENIKIKVSSKKTKERIYVLYVP